MKNYLGIDTGTKRMGLARGDSLLGMASPWKTLSVSGKRTLEELLQLIRDEGFDEVVIGLPRNMDGTEGESAERARQLGDQLREALSGVEVRLWDERLTSVEAGRQLRAAGRNEKESRKVVDQVAAGILLQSYLDALPGEGA